MISADETDTGEEFLSPKEARALLRVSERTFRRYVLDGRLVRAFRIPTGHARYRRADVIALRDGETATDHAAAPVADTGVAHPVVTVSASVLVAVLLTVGAVRPDVALAFLFAGIAAAAAIVTFGLIGGAVLDGSIAVGAAAARRHRLLAAGALRAPRHAGPARGRRD